ncbi:MAG: nicotinate-nucleotide adenylyltransferase [Bacteroidetes bacterium]|nr:nicotinate-nucleotide adenylyltransferase [Bacteroidota bacterium]
MKIALYFGSFNPIHNGHLIVANYLLNQTDVEGLWLIVSPQNPNKQENGLLNENQRLRLAKLATEHDERIGVSDIEFNLPRPSYTIDTLTCLSEKYPQHEYSLLMGADSFQNLYKWKNANQLVANYPLFVYPRQGFSINNNIGAQLNGIDAPMLNLSATYIRQCVANGKSIRYMVPDSVREEIEKGGYYKK